MIKRCIHLIFVTIMLLIILGCTNSNKYIISFEVNVGSTIDQISSDGKSIIPLPEEPIREGYSFNGWYFDNQSYLQPFKSDSLVNTPVYENISVYAKWTLNQYTIIFIIDGGDDINTITQNYNTKLKLPIPTKHGYRFIGWFIEETLTNECILTEMPAEDLTLYAKWERKSYSVTFYDYTGKEVKNDSVYYGDLSTEFEYNRKEDIRYIYDYIGWGTSRNSDVLFDFNLSIDKNLNLYPQYSKTKKSIDFTGMTISFLGDSITTFYNEGSPVNSYYSGSNQFYYPIYSSTVKKVDNTWWHKLSTLANLKIGVNNSWSATSCYNFGSSTNSGAMNQHRIDTLGENGAPNIIFIHIGTNDNVNGFSNTIFKNAYKTMVERIQKTYPHALIFVSTLGYSAYSGYEYTEQRRLDYNQIIREIALEKDLYVFAIDEIQTKDTYLQFLGDNLHPNINGMMAYAEKAYETLVEELTNVS